MSFLAASLAAATAQAGPLEEPLRAEQRQAKPRNPGAGRKARIANQRLAGTRLDVGQLVGLTVSSLRSGKSQDFAAWRDFEGRTHIVSRHADGKGFSSWTFAGDRVVTRKVTRAETPTLEAAAQADAERVAAEARGFRAREDAASVRARERYRRWRARTFETEVVDGGVRIDAGELARREKASLADRDSAYYKTATRNPDGSVTLPKGALVRSLVDGRVFALARGVTGQLREPRPGRPSVIEVVGGGGELTVPLEFSYPVEPAAE